MGAPAEGAGGPPADPPAAPGFDDGFRASLEALVRWRRDVRRFHADPVDEGTLRRILELAILSPSVGNSQPWRFVRVESPDRREAVRAEFERCNAQALEAYDGERARLYAGLKLAGLREAPVHLAVFCDAEPGAGAGLGRATIPETLRDSVVGAVQALWLVARAHGLGVGWVSILRPARVAEILDAPPSWSLVAYLCIGHAREEHLDPELVRHGWQDRLPLDAVLRSC